MYTFEAENERRQLGLPSRVRFKDHLSDQFTANTTLRGQNSRECVTTKLVLQVRHFISFRPTENKSTLFFSASWYLCIYLRSHMQYKALKLENKP